MPIPGGTETYVLCRSTARREKELAIRRRFSTRLEDRLRGLEHRVAAGRLKDRAKIERVLGRLQASYASVADLYEMAVRDEDGRLQLHWRLIEGRRAWRDAREGAYLLRTNLTGQTVEELWTKYIQLTEAEAAFRALKSELAVRPVFHQLERRVKAHLLVAFLGYALCGHTKTSAAPPRDRPHARAGPRTLRHAAERGHHLADDRRSSDPTPPCDAAHARAAAAARSARHHSPHPPRMECRM